MLTILAFVFALAVLIAVHEYGHYRVARAFGVKVLCFSIGFGRPILHWRSRRSGTEFVIAMFPIGGFVKMLDERDGPVSPGERSSALTTSPCLLELASFLPDPLQIYYWRPCSTV
jgi:regulator of sigma E protease